MTFAEQLRTGLWATCLVTCLVHLIAPKAILVSTRR